MKINNVVISISIVLKYNKTVNEIMAKKEVIKTVTIKDIAERAGVSFSTVSKALRNSPLVQEKTKLKVLRIAEEMGYQPNIAARRLVSKKSWAIGFVWPSVERATTGALMTLINEKLEERSYTTLLSINRIESAIAAFHRFQVDAIFIFYNHDEKVPPDYSYNTNIPILVYGVAGHVPYPTIDVRRDQATKLAVEHLYELGHRNIAYIGQPVRYDLLQEEKIRKFREEGTRLGLKHIIAPVENMETHSGYLAAKQILQNEGDRPTAIVSGSYDLTRGILQAAQELRLSVPEQLSIVSYDNIPQSANLEIPLTTVGVELSSIADKATETLLHLVDEESVPDAIYMEPELTLRRSTAPPAAR